MCLCVHFCLTLCDPIFCSLPDSSVHGIFQARRLGWAALPLLQGIFPIQGSNLHLPCLLHCRVDSLPLSHRGSPMLWAKCCTWILSVDLGLSKFSQWMEFLFFDLFKSSNIGFFYVSHPHMQSFQCVDAQSLHLCPTLCEHVDCRPGSSFHGILQARILERVSIPSPRGSSPPRDRTRVSCIEKWVLYPLSHLGSLWFLWCIPINSKLLMPLIRAMMMTLW